MSILSRPLRRLAVLLGLRPKGDYRTVFHAFGRNLRAVWQSRTAASHPMNGRFVMTGRLQ